MVCRTHKYANGGQVKCYADGGKVTKKGKKRKKKSPLVAEHDAAGRPVGVGGAQRRRTIDSIVDNAQTGRR